MKEQARSQLISVTFNVFTLSSELIIMCRKTYIVANYSILFSYIDKDLNHGQFIYSLQEET